MSGAILGASAAVVPSRGSAALPVDTNLLLPKPEDALSDDLDLVREIESNILHLYYVLVGRISSDISMKQQKLRADVEALERLAPQLKASIDACRVKSMTSLGPESTVVISKVNTAEPAIIAGQAQIVKFSSDRLNDLTTHFETQQNSATLSADAVALIGRIICQIGELQKPTQDLGLASDALTGASNGLRKQTNDIQNL